MTGIINDNHKVDDLVLNDLAPRLHERIAGVVRRHDDNDLGRRSRGRPFFAMIEGPPPIVSAGGQKLRVTMNQDAGAVRWRLYCAATDHPTCVTMALALDRIRLMIPEHVITRVVDDTTVVLDVNTGRSFTLDAIGTRVWTLLVSAPSAQAACDTLLSEYAGDPSQVRADLEQMIEQLTTNRLLSVQAL